MQAIHKTTFTLTQGPSIYQGSTKNVLIQLPPLPLFGPCLMVKYVQFYVIVTCNLFYCGPCHASPWTVVPMVLLADGGTVGIGVGAL